jgi:hypothetical protein
MAGSVNEVILVGHLGSDEMRAASQTRWAGRRGGGCAGLSGGSGPAGDGLHGPFCGLCGAIAPGEVRP